VRFSAVAVIYRVWEFNGLDFGLEVVQRTACGAGLRVSIDALE
jgi:hypothetical protein